MSDELNAPTRESLEPSAGTETGAGGDTHVDTAIETTGEYGADSSETIAATSADADTPTPDELRDSDGSIADNVHANPDGSLTVDDEADDADTASPEEDDKNWYVLKVASNRERTVKKALERQIKRENLEEFFGDIVIPTQKVKETKNGKVVEKEEKIWPGYIVVNMAINDDSWYLVRSVSGIGDFAGKAGEPSPMPEDEVAALLGKKVEAEPGEEKEPEAVKINIPFSVGERVKVNETSLAGSEGDVTAIDAETGQVKVTIQFLGQPTDVDFEHWQLEKV